VWIRRRSIYRAFGSASADSLGQGAGDGVCHEAAAQGEQISDLRHIKLSEIVADPNQPRRTFDEASLEELSASIKEHGILQPIVVVPHEGKYMIVAGERRFRAATRAGLGKLAA